MFKDSCVIKLTPFEAVEEATVLPENVFPVYIGSGQMALALDATGIQGLNHGVQKSYNCFPNAGDLYCVQQGVIGDKIAGNCSVPLGYFTWNLEYDGHQINHENLKQHASLWRRSIRIDRSECETSMLIDGKFKMYIKTWIPFGSSMPVFEFDFEGYDCSNQPIKQTIDIKIEVQLHLVSRTGRPLYDSLEVKNQFLHGVIQGRENYPFDIMAAGGQISVSENRLSVCAKASAGKNRMKKKTAFFYGFNENLAAVDLCTLYKSTLDSWQSYYKECASVQGLSLKETYLYNNCLYLFRAGFIPEQGFQIGAPFYSPSCWCSSTFWDSDMVCDSIMRIGNKEAAKSFVQMLRRIVKTDGSKPFPWMFTYDGKASIEPKFDIAPLAITAHATTAIKYYEYFQDALADIVYPVVKACGDYAIKNLLGLRNGRWILEKAVSNDVVETEAKEVNHTYTFVWFLVILQKTIEYANILGCCNELDPRYYDIVENFYLESNEEEYLHCAGETAADSNDASWLPFLLYPTEAMPFIDKDLCLKTRKKYSFRDLYMEKQGCFQPWTEFLQASSDFRLGEIEAGYKLRVSGMEHIYGCGYFSEIGPWQQTVGLPPYISAHGSFVSALLYQFISTSIWEKELGIFTSLPAAYSANDLRVSNVVCAKALKVSAQINRFSALTRILGDVSGYCISLRLPIDLEPGLVEVFMNGLPVAFELDMFNNLVKVQLPNETTNEIVLEVR